MVEIEEILGVDATAEEDTFNMHMLKELLVLVLEQLRHLPTPPMRLHTMRAISMRLLNMRFLNMRKLPRVIPAMIGSEQTLATALIKC